MVGGVFDKDKSEGNQMAPESDKETTVTDINTKTNFQGPHEMAKRQSSEISEKISKKMVKTSTEQKIDNVNQMLSGTTEQNNLEREFKEIDKISPEDLKLAEALIFRGYAEKQFQMEHFENKTFTICTMNADEVSLVEEMLFDIVKENNDEDGNIDIPEVHFTRMRNIFNVALCYKGDNGKDICQDRICHLEVIKKAVAKMAEYEGEGQLKEFKELKDSVKKSLKKRAVIIKRLPVPVIDMFSNAKYEFDNLMFRIMNAKGIYPKS